MKGKFLSVVVFVMVGVVLLFDRRQALASIAPVLAVDQVLTAVNSGDLDEAVILFAEDAAVENKVRRETYQGQNEIRQMLQGMQRDGRRYEIVELKMDGDLITMEVQISDRGLVWGTETIEAVVEDGSVKTFNVTGIRLHLWRSGS